MQFTLVDLGVIATLLISGFSVVSFVIRQEGKFLHQKIETLERRMEKMDKLLEKLADVTGELGIMQERMLAHGKRADEADRRANEMATRLSRLSEPRARP
jgi:hypothetical protein